MLVLFQDDYYIQSKDKPTHDLACSCKYPR